MADEPLQINYLLWWWDNLAGELPAHKPIRNGDTLHIQRKKDFVAYVQEEGGWIKVWFPENKVPDNVKSYDTQSPLDTAKFIEDMTAALQ